MPGTPPARVDRQFTARPYGEVRRKSLAEAKRLKAAGYVETFRWDGRGYPGVEVAIVFLISLPLLTIPMWIYLVAVPKAYVIRASYELRRGSAQTDRPKRR